MMYKGTNDAQYLLDVLIDELDNERISFNKQFHKESNVVSKAFVQGKSIQTDSIIRRLSRLRNAL